MATMPKDAQDLFDNLVPQGLQQYPDKARELNAIYCVKITGDGGGEWTVDCTSNPPTCLPAFQAGRPLATGSYFEIPITLLPLADVANVEIVTRP